MIKLLLINIYGEIYWLNNLSLFFLVYIDEIFLFVYIKGIIMKEKEWEILSANNFKMDILGWKI